MLNTKEWQEVLKYLKKNCQAAFNLGARVWLFGSRARCNNRSDSDWDVLIEVAHGTYVQDSFPSGKRMARRLTTKEQEIAPGVKIGLLMIGRNDWDLDDQPVQACKKEGKIVYEENWPDEPKKVRS